MRKKHKILDLLKKQGKPLTHMQLAFMLNIPTMALNAELCTLRATGEIQEFTLEQLLRDGK